MPAAFAKWKRLTSHQRKRLRDEVLVKRFTRASLDKFLSEDIGGTNLEMISTDSNFTTQCDDVLGRFSDLEQAGDFCSALWLKLTQQRELLEQIAADTSTGFIRNPLRDYLYLFDRADQEDLFVDKLSQFDLDAPVPPVVVVISGLPDDEADLMLDRIMQRAIPALYGTRYQKTVPHMLNWVTTVSKEKLVRELGNKILGIPTLRGTVDGLIKEMTSRIAGQTVCMTLQLNQITRDSARILGEFFLEWSRLGAHARPAIFFLLVVDGEMPSGTAETYITPGEAYAEVKKACPPDANLVTVIDHLALGLCDPNHIRVWRSDLDELPLDKDIIKSACDILDTRLGKLPAFRLRQVKSELGG